MTEVTSVFVVTSGDYSNYGINGVFASIESAKAATPMPAGRYAESYDIEQYLTWPPQ